jgi:hypothetical protein
MTAKIDVRCWFGQFRQKSVFSFFTTDVTELQRCISLILSVFLFRGHLVLSVASVAYVAFSLFRHGLHGITRMYLTYSFCSVFICVICGVFSFFATDCTELHGYIVLILYRFLFSVHLWLINNTNHHTQTINVNCSNKFRNYF